eukprot:SAG31_NODE_27886_length_418_cov_1.921630_1_plen_52_part_01
MSKCNNTYIVLDNLLSTVAFKNAEQVLDCAWILVVLCVLLCKIVGGGGVKVT